jgi:hypothetical protein
MAWDIVFKPEAQRWFDGLDPVRREQIGGAIETVRQGGPTTGEPCVKRIRGSCYHNMKELRSVGGHLRMLFAFDPNRRGVLLVGGDKAGNWNGWYKDNIPEGDRIYAQHLRGIGKGGNHRQRGQDLGRGPR